VIPWLRAAVDDSSVLASFGEHDLEVTFGKAVEDGLRMARLLRDLGVKSNDRVVAKVGNRPEFLSSFIGSMLVGACFVPINPELPEEKALALREKLSPAATVVEGADGVSVRADNVVFSTKDLESLQPLSWSSTHDAGAREVAFMLFTGGTTGTPKGILLSHHFVKVFAEYWIKSAQVRRGDIHLQDLPFHHANGLLGVLMSFAVRRRMAIYSRFSLSRYWGRIQESGATTTTWLGTMGHLVTKHPDARPSTLDRVKWIPRPPEVQDIEAKLHLRLIESYGSTEGGIISWTDDTSGPIGCGRARSPYKVSIEAEDGTACRPGNIGEIVIRCEDDGWMCSGYWRDGVEELHPVGLHELRSGDLGTWLDDGTFRVVGRATGDIIRRKGENISTREIELAALLHPLVLEAASVATATDIGTDILLVCRVADSLALKPSDLSNFLTAHLTKQARPRFIAFTEELPKTIKQIIPKHDLVRYLADAWDAESQRA
jgi:crotonobetaine/carnitine-CoA ligase